jgi:hypothetical protein
MKFTVSVVADVTVEQGIRLNLHETQICLSLHRKYPGVDTAILQYKGRFDKIS